MSITTTNRRTTDQWLPEKFWRKYTRKAVPTPLLSNKKYAVSGLVRVAEGEFIGHWLLSMPRQAIFNAKVCWLLYN